MRSCCTSKAYPCLTIGIMGSWINGRLTLVFIDFRLQWFGMDFNTVFPYDAIPSLSAGIVPTIKGKALIIPLKIHPFYIRSYLKNRILVQGQGGAEVQPAGILKYSELLKRGSKTEIGTKDIFEIASNVNSFIYTIFSIISVQAKRG